MGKEVYIYWVNKMCLTCAHLVSKKSIIVLRNYHWKLDLQVC